MESSPLPEEPLVLRNMKEFSKLIKYSDEIIDSEIKIKLKGLIATIQSIESAEGRFINKNKEIREKLEKECRDVWSRGTDLALCSERVIENYQNITDKNDELIDKLYHTLVEILEVIKNERS